jgi:hypothetical protein
MAKIVLDTTSPDLYAVVSIRSPLHPFPVT